MFDWLLKIAFSCATLCMCADACTSERISSSTVASVGSYNILATELVVRLLQIRGFKSATYESQKKSAFVIVDSLIDDRALYLEALSRGIRAEASVADHQMRYQRALVGETELARFQRENFVDQEAWSQHFEREVTFKKLFRSLRNEGKSICTSAIRVQSLKNCISRQELLKDLRKKYSVEIYEASVLRALQAIREKQ